MLEPDKLSAYYDKVFPVHFSESTSHVILSGSVCSNGSFPVKSFV